MKLIQDGCLFLDDILPTVDHPLSKKSVLICVYSMTILSILTFTPIPSPPNPLPAPLCRAGLPVIGGKNLRNFALYYKGNSDAYYRLYSVSRCNWSNGCVQPDYYYLSYITQHLSRDCIQKSCDIKYFL